jgi:hypothetical protein
MKKLFIILFTLYGAIAMAQGPGVPKPSNYTWISHRYDWLSGKFRGLHVPAGTTPALIDGQYTGAGALFVDSVNHRFYFYSGGNWRYAGGIDSVTYETDSTFIWQSGNSYGIPSGASTLQQIFDQENGRAVLSQVDTVDMNDNKLLFYSGDDLKYYFGLETFQAIIDPGTGGSAGLTISEYGLFSNMFGSSGNFGRIWMDLATESTKSTFRIIADSVQFDISRGSPLSIADSASNYMVVMDKATGHLRAAYWPIGGSGSGGFFGDETNSGGATTKDGNGEDYTITGVDTFSLSGNSIYLSPVDSLMLENISVDGEGETPEEITNLLGITGTGKVKAAPDYFGRFGTDGDPIATANRAFDLQDNQLIIAGSEDDNGSSFKINPYEVNLHSSYLTGGVRLLFQDGETGSLHGETGAGNSGFFVDITDTDNPEVEVKSHGNINLEATLSGKQISLNTPTYLFQFPDITDNSGHIYVNKQFQRGTSSQVVYYDSTAQEFLWGPAPSGGGGGFFTSSSSTGNTTQDGEGDVFRLIDVSEFGIRATSSGSLDRFRVDATSTVMVSNEGNAFISASDGRIDLDAAIVNVPINAGVGERYAGYNADGDLIVMATPGGGSGDGIDEVIAGFGLTNINDSTLAVDTTGAFEDWVESKVTANLLVSSKGTYGKRIWSTDDDTLFLHTIDEGYGINITKSADSTNVISADTTQLSTKDNVLHQISLIPPSTGTGVVLTDDPLSLSEDFAMGIDTLRHRGFIKEYNIVRWLPTTDSAATLTPLSTPGSFTATTIDDDEIGLSWSDVANETNYEIYRNTVNTFGTATLINSPAANATSYTSTGLSASTQYYYWILAEGDGVTYSNSATATDDATTDAGLDSDASAYLARITAHGVTPTAPQQAAVNQAFLDLKSNSLYTLYYDFYFFGWNNAAANAEPFKAVAPDISWVNSPTHSSNGVTFNGTTQYGNLGFAPSVLTLNNTGLGIKTSSTSNATVIDMGVRGATATVRFDLLAMSSSLLTGEINSNTAGTGQVTGSVASPAGFSTISRTSSTDLRAYRDGSQVGSTSTTTNNGTMPTGNIYIGAVNNNGSPSLYTARTYQMAWVYATAPTSGQVATQYTILSALNSAFSLP